VKFLIFRRSDLYFLPGFRKNRKTDEEFDENNDQEFEDDYLPDAITKNF